MKHVTIGVAYARWWLALAPWQQAHREQIIKGIASRDWRDLYSPGMPIRYFPKEGEEYPDTPPPFEPDQIYP